MASCLASPAAGTLGWPGSAVGTGPVHRGDPALADVNSPGRARRPGPGCVDRLAHPATASTATPSARAAARLPRRHHAGRFRHQGQLRLAPAEPARHAREREERPPRDAPPQTRNAAQLWRQLASAEGKWIRHAIERTGHNHDDLGFAAAGPPPESGHKDVSRPDSRSAPGPVPRRLRRRRSSGPNDLFGARNAGRWADACPVTAGVSAAGAPGSYRNTRHPPYPSPPGRPSAGEDDAVREPVTQMVPSEAATMPFGGLSGYFSQ